MTALSKDSNEQPARSMPIPPLESGDSPLETLRERLTRAEFERRYEAIPEKFKAELIEAVEH